MKCSAVVLGIVLLAATATAQSNFDGSRLSAAPGPAAAVLSSSQPATPQPSLWADASPGAGAAPSPAPAAGAIPAIFPTHALDAYKWQLYAGYTFFNFYEIPNLTNLENGFDAGVTYYPGGGWIGAEGALTVTFGAQAGCISKFTLASGGARVRWSGPEGTQFWLHGLAGGSHFFPQTAYGGQNAFGYELGGGVDISAHHRRMAYRAEIDAVGTRFFHSYQFSPKVSVGIVFNF